MVADRLRRRAAPAPSSRGWAATSSPSCCTGDDAGAESVVAMVRHAFPLPFELGRPAGHASRPASASRCRRGGDDVAGPAAAAPTSRCTRPRPGVPGSRSTERELEAAARRGSRCSPSSKAPSRTASSPSTSSPRSTPGDGEVARRRGAGPMEPPGARLHRPGRVHPGGGAQRADHTADVLGARQSLAACAVVAARRLASSASP